ncbi:MAG TPA: TIGR03862 family flavoprotein, partial [Roseococcus sp.]|nr:TIGR03862 family flavoprotein [Roseococcus sp.]
MNQTSRQRGVAVIGGGPAGLMAAERARAAGVDVEVYEAKGSVGRKFLIAGKGGLNLTHSDPPEAFARRYRERHGEIGRWLQDFDADALRRWAHGLGVETFVGSSGRVFPADLKAAPLLRGWVRRLREDGVRFHVHHRWTGWDQAGALAFETPAGRVVARHGATVLALGGGSWPQLGSDGAWVPWLAARGIEVAP